MAGLPDGTYLIANGGQRKSLPFQPSSQYRLLTPFPQTAKQDLA